MNTGDQEAVRRVEDILKKIDALRRAQGLPTLEESAEQLKRENDWFNYMHHIHRLLLRLFRSENWGGYTTSEDTTVFVGCACGAHFSATSGWIEWCPGCGRGYSTEFKTFCYPAWLGRVRK